MDWTIKPYAEAGTLGISSARSGQPLEIRNSDQPKAWFNVPTSRVMPPGMGTLHIILAAPTTARRDSPATSA